MSDSSRTRPRGRRSRHGHHRKHRLHPGAASGIGLALALRLQTAGNTAVTGGVSVFALAAAGMFVIGCLGWVFALAAGVFFLAVPALLAWLVLGALGAPVWLVITAISLALASFVVPFILDLRSGERAGQLPR